MSKGGDDKVCQCRRIDDNYIPDRGGVILTEECGFESICVVSMREMR